MRCRENLNDALSVRNYVERLSSHEVACRFGYTPGSFRVLCHQFRNDLAKPAAFFPAASQGPQSAPARGRVRDLVVAMRKRNLSVYDIRRELADAGHHLSINALAVLLREEGFARLPRRLDEERPQALRPGAAAMANVRVLSTAPRSFRTRVGGLWLFVPLMRDIRLAEVLRTADLPGSAMIPAEQAVRTLLALKLVGKERKSPVMDLVCDEGGALFAGLNVVPKRSYLAAYSSRVERRTNMQLLGVWSDEVHRVGLPRGNSFDLDFHTVPANAQEEPLEKHYVSSRSRRQKGVLVFLARDATERVLCYAHAGIPKAQQPDEILRFVEFWQRRTGGPPAELVFDSQLTTRANLNRLNQGLAPNKLVVWCYNRFASFRSNDGGEPWSPSPITEPSMSAVAPIANEAGEAPSSRSIGPSINWSPSWMRSGVGCSPASGRRSTVGEGSHGWRSSPG